MVTGFKMQLLPKPFCRRILHNEGKHSKREIEPLPCIYTNQWHLYAGAGQKRLPRFKVNMIPNTGYRKSPFYKKAQEAGDYIKYFKISKGTAIGLSVGAFSLCDLIIHLKNKHMQSLKKIPCSYLFYSCCLHKVP